MRILYTLGRKTEENLRQLLLFRQRGERPAPASVAIYYTARGKLSSSFVLSVSPFGPISFIRTEREDIYIPVASGWWRHLPATFCFTTATPEIPNRAYCN